MVTVAVPSFNQGRFLDKALTSIFEQEVPVEVFVLDGGSTDDSLKIISRWRHHLAGFRSHRDDGQAAAINEGIQQGRGKFVCWLNSDDWFLPGALSRLVSFAEANPTAPMVYGQCLNYLDKTGAFNKVWVEPFNECRLAARCIISQPGTLIRRSAWERVGGVDPNLTMTMDYDLWWRLHKAAGSPLFFGELVAVNRVHFETKTMTHRRLHYQEAIATVRRHHGRVPLKWWLAQPYSVWFKSFVRRFQS
ncbi:glycosyltransferase family 2 protein [Rhizobium laguerreae]|uniref:glycosyltransferase family 2 protein n=1 Tax=Rhizobium laguerreae TaxID=1076926 RepID=UPI0028C49B74|nr:glycosyltransferase family 2 protein [Rhizobium laguerreae]